MSPYHGIVGDDLVGCDASERSLPTVFLALTDELQCAYHICPIRPRNRGRCGFGGC